MIKVTWKKALVLALVMLLSVGLLFGQGEMEQRQGRLAPAAGNSSPSRPSDENIASVNKPRVRVISPPIPADMCKHTCEDDGCPSVSDC